MLRLLPLSISLNIKKKEAKHYFLAVKNDEDLSVIGILSISH